MGLGICRNTKERWDDRRREDENMKEPKNNN